MVMFPVTEAVVFVTSGRSPGVLATKGGKVISSLTRGRDAKKVVGLHDGAGKGLFIVKYLLKLDRIFHATERKTLLKALGLNPGPLALRGTAQTSRPWLLVHA